MKILFLSHYFPPEGNAPASRVHAMCRRFVASGHEVEVLTCAPNVPDGIVYPGYRNALHQVCDVDGIRVHRGYTFVAANRGTALRILNYLSYVLMALVTLPRLQKPDLVVATSPQFFCGWAGVWLARLLRRPFVLEIRDIWPESISALQHETKPTRGLLATLRQLAGRAINSYLEWLEMRMYEAADHIVTVGEGYKNKLVERGVAPDHISIVSNGVETDLYQPRPADPELRRQAGANPDQFLIGYIGTIGMAHGLRTVIEAARLAAIHRLNQLQFVIVGDGAQREQLETELARDNPGNLRFVGRRPKSEMPAWLASVDACLVHLRDLPLFESVMPSKIFEALAMERPILLGVRGQAQTLIERSGGGLCLEPEDASALLEGAETLARDRARAHILGRTGRSFVVREYGLDNLARRYATILQAVLDIRCGDGRHNQNEGRNAAPTQLH